MIIYIGKAYSQQDLPDHCDLLPLTWLFDLLLNINDGLTFVRFGKLPN